MASPQADQLTGDDALEERSPEPRWRRPSRTQVIAVLVYAVTAVLLITYTGLPTDPVKIFIYLWAGVIAWNFGRPWRSHLRFGRDWAAIVILLVVYNYSRGFADNGTLPHITEMIHADEWMFGRLTGGEIPTLWLQQHFYNPTSAQWYDVLASFVYFSHFVAALTVAAVLWVRNRTAWASFVRRWFTLCALGLATYFIYPAAPPWWAAQYGYLPPIVHGVATRGWYAIGMTHGGNLLNAAKLDGANLVAAMPSLHSGFSMTIAVFFMMRTRKRWWPLLAAYPLAMALTLVYSGEHYVTDVLVGWLYVAISFTLVGVAERFHARVRRVPLATPATESGSSPAEPVTHG
jgi:hypothetical protein